MAIDIHTWNNTKTKQAIQNTVQIQKQNNTKHSKKKHILRNESVGKKSRKHVAKLHKNP